VADEHHLPRLEGAAGLEASGATDEADGRAESLRGRVAHAMVGMKKDYYGKGPTRAKAFFNDEYLFVVMEGGLTRNEETLLEAGEERLVREYRLRFQEAVATTITAAVEEATGCKVLAYHSQIVFDPDRAFEIFVLDGPPRPREQRRT
jgi:uncharacterized protein YbcI